jgi:pimeloyl-ACP methyl ester carboxylesterase
MADGTDGPLEGRLRLPDGRRLSWTEWGDPRGHPVVRVHGTPGSRYPIQADPGLWARHGVRLIVPERPGYGEAGRLPGRGWLEPVNDLAAILDALDIPSVAIYGGSGATPYVLGFALRHPDRTEAASVANGTAPVTPAEAESMVPFNVAGWRLARAGRLAELERCLEDEATSLMPGEIPVSPDGSKADSAGSQIPFAIRASWARSMAEAIRHGVGGWLDDVVFDSGDWPGLEAEAVEASLTWWHAADDRHCPLAAAKRLVARLPRATLRIEPDADHLTGIARGDSDVLEELLARAEIAADRAAEATGDHHRADQAGRSPHPWPGAEHGDGRHAP